MPRFAYLTRAVWLLSLISLCTDLASEMPYPVMPPYLRHHRLFGLLHRAARRRGRSRGGPGQGLLRAAATEGVAKAWISTLCAPADAGAALGTFAGLSSLAALAASAGAGLLWQGRGPTLAFGVAAVALGVAGYLARVRLAPA